MAANQHLVDKNGGSKGDQPWLCEADPCGLLRCLLGSISARIVRSYGRCFWACLFRVMRERALFQGRGYGYEDQ